MKKLFTLIINYLNNFHREIIKFTITGFIATGVNLGLLFVLTEFLSFWYIFSSVIAYITAITISFILQKVWTFQDINTDRIKQQISSHITLSILGLIFNTIFLYVLVEYLNVWYILAQILTAFIIAITNFVAYKYIIFKRV